MGLPRCLILFLVVSLFVPLAHAAGTPDAKIVEEKNHLHVTLGGQPFTDYYFGEREDRPYVRPFFYPVLTSDGVGVTSDQYTNKGGDHPHHQSLWVAHGDVNGVDHWALNGKESPKQRHVRFSEVKDDHFIEELEWDGKEAKEGKPILRETRTVRFFGYPDGSRGMDFTIRLAPTDGPVTLGDTKEAGLVSVRVAPSIPKHPTLVNSKGETGEKAVWGKPADWCDLSGPIDGKQYGVAVFDAPENPRHPTQWHAREYGLLSANPFGLSYYDPKKYPKHSGDLVIERDKPITFRYRVVIHAGGAKEAALAQKYQAFARQPSAAAQ